MTHVVNAAEGKHIGMVDLTAEYYAKDGINYIGFQLTDLPITNISRYFHEAADYIDEALNSGGKYRKFKQF